MLRGHAVGYVKRLPTPLNFLQRVVEKLSNAPGEGCRPKKSKRFDCPLKWAKIAKCFQDTALRDIFGFVDHGILAKGAGGGHSTSYSLTQANEPRAGCSRYWAIDL
jgi:hypothetical protein